MIWHFLFFFFFAGCYQIQTCEWNGRWMRNASLSPLAACENTTSAGDGKCADPYSEPSIAIWNENSRLDSTYTRVANYGRLFFFLVGFYFLSSKCLYSSLSVWLHWLNVSNCGFLSNNPPHNNNRFQIRCLSICPITKK